MSGALDRPQGLYALAPAAQPMGPQDMLARLLKGNPDPGLPGYPVMQSAEDRGFAPMPRSFGDAGQRMAAVLRGDVEPTPEEGRQIATVRGFTEGPATIRAFHGSPHRFDRFDMSRIGTGEGAQAYGHGLYFAGNENVAKAYKDAGPAAAALYAEKNARLSDLARQMSALESGGGYRQFRDQALGNKLAAEYDDLMAGRANLGSMYEVNLNTTPDRLLDWDAPFERQLPQVQNAMSSVFGRDNLSGSANKTIGHRFGALSMNQFGREGGDAAASAALREAGIPGIQYLDAGSRAAGEGSRNYVMFDDKLIDILRRYGVAGTLGGGAAATSGTSE